MKTLPVCFKCGAPAAEFVNIDHTPRCFILCTDHWAEYQIWVNKEFSLTLPDMLRRLYESAARPHPM